jgi:YesN/AraC family two-component response regulator
MGRSASKILVVEDDAGLRESLCDLLEDAGFRVSHAGTVTAGLARAAAEPPDVVLCDFRLQDGTGREVVAGVRAADVTASTPIIILSSWANRDHIREVLAAGASDYLVKPCDPDTLFRAIAAQVDLPAAPVHVEPPDVPGGFKVPWDVSLVQANPRIAAAFAYIQARYAESISLKDVAKAVGYSAAYLTDLSARLTGNSIQRWIIEIRMADAGTRLRTGTEAVDSIAHAIGYQDTGHFIRLFKQFYGMTPQVWRQNREAARDPGKASPKKAYAAEK